ncbi:hypothetical protein M0813_29061 [Anaeramoeba flamelloides]|uniref:Uncharacterized protein n=1 Tax=Anaeramoeba flamelloides TaxID=1746091 RepID=A0ABQ8XRA6_9EUKA|nr:hypothetical protein M0813_29061 [Anaeramoeba flamelloides]
MLQILTQKDNARVQLRAELLFLSKLKNTIYIFLFSHRINILYCSILFKNQAQNSEITEKTWCLATTFSVLPDNGSPLHDQRFSNPGNSEISRVTIQMLTGTAPTTGDSGNY